MKFTHLTPMPRYRKLLATAALVAVVGSTGGLAATSGAAATELREAPIAASSSIQEFYYPLQSTFKNSSKKPLWVADFSIQKQREQPRMVSPGESIQASSPWGLTGFRVWNSQPTDIENCDALLTHDNAQNQYAPRPYIMPNQDFDKKLDPDQYLLKPMSQAVVATPKNDVGLIFLMELKRTDVGADEFKYTYNVFGVTQQ